MKNSNSSGGYGDKHQMKLKASMLNGDINQHI
jgi:hypothetical protein